MSGRIPLALQSVFVASNQGEEVYEAPTSAYQVFQNLWSGVRRTRSGRSQRVPRATSGKSVASFSQGAAAAAKSPKTSSKTKNGPLVVTPQKWLDEYLASRNYRTNRTKAGSTAYFNEPTPLQCSSYGGKLVEICTNGKDEAALREILATGLSPNACNKHGETIMHKVCRLGHYNMLKIFLEYGGEIRICDAQGRTLLHDTCWGARPSVRIFSLLLLNDPYLLYTADCRGATPLEYVRKEDYVNWINFFQMYGNKLWPRRQVLPPLPDLWNEPPYSKPIIDPQNALTCELAGMVASGWLKPKDALLLMTPRSTGHDNDSDDESTDSYDSDEDSDGSDDSSGSEESYSESSYDTEPDMELLQDLGVLLV